MILLIHSRTSTAAPLGLKLIYVSKGAPNISWVAFGSICITLRPQQNVRHFADEIFSLFPYIIIWWVFWSKFRWKLFPLVQLTNLPDIMRADNDLVPYVRSAITWWRHQMETLSALLAICAGNSPVTGEFPTQRPVTWSFDVYFDLRTNERLSKQSWGWWFETLSRSLWRHRNDLNKS